MSSSMDVSYVVDEVSCFTCDNLVQEKRTLRCTSCNKNSCKQCIFICSQCTAPVCLTCKDASSKFKAICIDCSPQHCVPSVSQGPGTYHSRKLVHQPAECTEDDLLDDEDTVQSILNQHEATEETNDSDVSIYSCDEEVTDDEYD